MTVLNKIDSNATGLRYCEEDSFKTVSGDEVWNPLEPNSYADFGGSTTLTPREPINAGRQNQKGVVTDLDASGGFETDLTQTNMEDLLQGFFFADLRPKAEFGGASEITNVDGTTEDYDAASGLDAFNAEDLVFASGFTNAANNGLKTVSAVSATALTVNENLLDETPPAAAKLVQVGVVMGSGELDVDVSGSLPVLTRASGTIDFTDYGIVPGEFIYVGGDSAGQRFANAENNGFMRVKAVTASTIMIDKAESTMVSETGTGLTVYIFMGRVLKNESDTSLITRRTYQLERTLGAPDDSSPSNVQAEYLVGCVANTFDFQIPAASKLVANVGFVAADHETIDGPTSLKAGTRPALVAADAFNTASNIPRIKMNIITAGSENPSALFAYLTELAITIGNGATPNKAVGTLGAFEVTVGNFVVGGSATAYFQNVAAIAAVRANADVTLEAHLVKDNAGQSLDIPLIALGDARANVEKDQPITLPLEINAAAGAKIDANQNHTLLMVFWDYLPDAAE